MSHLAGHDGAGLGGVGALLLPETPLLYGEALLCVWGGGGVM